MGMIDIIILVIVAFSALIGVFRGLVKEALSLASWFAAILAGTLSFAQHHPEHFLLPFFGFLAAALTAFYMFRLIFMTFHGNPNIKSIVKNIHESSKEMTSPIVLLILPFSDT